MTGRAGPPGDQNLRYYPPGQQSGRYPAPPGYGQPAPFGGPPLQPPVPPRRSSGRAPAPGRKPRINYPRRGRTGFIRWIPSWKLFTGTTLLTVLGLVVAILVAYAATPIPPQNHAIEAQATIVYYSDGKTELTRFAAVNRTDVTLDQVPWYVQWEVMSAEDRTFWDNKGVSPVGIVRAAWNNARGGALQGGSTITQQYVKNTRTDGGRNFQRKIKEFFVAIKIANETPKKDILRDYLNAIYFGRNAYGIQAAAQAYFGVDVAKLTPAQGAYLAGIINGPELYDTQDGDAAIQRAQRRYDYVLDGLALLDAQKPGLAALATQIRGRMPMAKQQVHPATKEDDQTVYLAEMVKAELRERDPGGPDPAKAGYRITTTFDKKMIDQAVASVHDVLGPRKTWTTGTQVGLVTLDPTTGEVKAIYGGDGKTRFQNAATQDAPQAGSTMKPFTLIAALESGISLDSRFSGRNPYVYKAGGQNAGQKVNNFDGESFGMIDLKTATAHSVNTVFAALNDKIGDGSGTKTMKVAERAGIPKGIVTDEVSNVLGNASAHVIDMASAYGTIAAQGVYVKPHVIREIKNATGGVVDGRKYPAERRFSADVTADATYALQQVINGGTGSYAQRLNRPAAGKTGTVGSKTGRETKAAWFVGFTPQLSTAVAIHNVGKNNSRADVVGWGPFKGENLQGGMFPVRVWTDFMASALKGKDEIPFPPPAHVGEAFDPAPPPTTTTTSTDTTSPTTGGQPTDPNAPGSPSPTGPAPGGPTAPPTGSPPGNGPPGGPTTTASS